MYDITICIPTMNRFDVFLSKIIPCYLALPFIKKIVVSDENGRDNEKILQQSWGSSPLLELHQNSTRQGAYMNKKIGLSYIKDSWVALIDSDNCPTPKYWEALFNEWSSNGRDVKTIYCAAKSKFIGDNKESFPIDHFGGFTINKETWNTVLNIPQWNMLLNDGNYVIHSSAFNNISNVPENKCYAADVIVMNKELVSKGYSMKIIQDMEYIHCVHNDSYWIKTGDESQALWDSTNWKL